MRSSRNPKPTLGITALDSSVTVSIVTQASGKFGIIVYQAGRCRREIPESLAGRHEQR